MVLNIDMALNSPSRPPIPVSPDAHLLVALGTVAAAAGTSLFFVTETGCPRLPPTLSPFLPFREKPKP